MKPRYMHNDKQLLVLGLSAGDQHQVERAGDMFNSLWTGYSCPPNSCYNPHPNVMDFRNGAFGR